MSYFFVNNATGKIYASMGGDPDPSYPPPDGYSTVTVIPDDRRMTWDFINSVWFWDKTGLLLISKDYFTAGMAALMTIGGAGVSLTTPAYLATYLSALGEDPTATRAISGDGITFVSRSNADLISDFETFFEGFQKTFAVAALVAADINSTIITDPAGITTAWATYGLAYSDTRTKLPSHAEMVEMITTMELLPGPKGDDGANGKSAYELAVAAGFVGTVLQWLASLTGANGTNGKSAYQLAVDGGFVGDVTAWIASLKGATGDTGPATVVSQSGATRALNTAFQVSATRWAHVKYAVQQTVTASITGGQNGDIVLEIASDSGFTTNVQTLDINGFGQTYTLAIAIQGVQPQTTSVSGWVPPGYYVRLRSVNNTGTPGFTYRAGQEALT